LNRKDGIILYGFNQAIFLMGNLIMISWKSS